MGNKIRVIYLIVLLIFKHTKIILRDIYIIGMLLFKHTKLILRDIYIGCRFTFNMHSIFILGLLCKYCLPCSKTFDVENIHEFHDSGSTCKKKKFSMKFGHAVPTYDRS